jgi:hypothetical protein
MSTSEEPRPLSLHRSQLAADAFTEYCDSERERRRNTGEGFDPALFDETVELVLQKLHKLDQGGSA